jgi:hypothetical protein
MKEKIDMNLPNFIHAALKFPKSKTGLENKGRYYLAKIIGNDGRVVNQLLVDKQNATIHFLKTPLKRMS